MFLTVDMTGPRLPSTQGCKQEPRATTNPFFPSRFFIGAFDHITERKPGQTALSNSSLFFQQKETLFFQFTYLLE